MLTVTEKLPEFTEEELVASICRESFFMFVQEFWETVVPEKPVWNWHIPYLCQVMQDAAELVFKGAPKSHDIVINVPPGTTKSTICSVMFPAWVWTRMPSARCICGSYTFPLAMDLSRKSRDVITSDKYKAVFPKIALREDQNTKSYFVNHQGGMRYAVGVGGSVTGMHAHFLIIDDPLDPNASASDEEIKNANRWCSETLPSRKVNKAVTPMFLIMQRLHQDDPTGHVLARKKVNIFHICLPAEVSDLVKPPELAAHYTDGLLDTTRLSRAVLEEAKSDLGDFGYAGQFDQNPVPRGGGMFRVGRLRFEPQPPAKWARLVRYWDKAGTGGGGAFTVGVKMGLDLYGFFWLLDVIRGQWEASTREGIIQKTAQFDGHSVVVYVEQEGGSGGKESAEATVRRLAGYRVIIDRPTGNKELRADPFAYQVNAGNVVLIPAPWNGDFLEEMRFFPKSRYKDQIDASSGAFAMLSKPRLRAGAL